MTVSSGRVWVSVATCAPRGCGRLGRLLRAIGAFRPWRGFGLGRLRGLSSGLLVGAARAIGAGRLKRLQGIGLLDAGLGDLGLDAGRLQRRENLLAGQAPLLGDLVDALLGHLLAALLGIVARSICPTAGVGAHRSGL